VQPPSSSTLSSATAPRDRSSASGNGYRRETDAPLSSPRTHKRSTSDLLRSWHADTLEETERTHIRQARTLRTA
jgi:hypothetical protein